MFRLALIILVVCGPLFQVHAAWELHKSYGDTHIYKSSDGHRLTLRGEKVELNLEKIDEKQAQAVEDTKKDMLRVIGVRDWEVSARDLTELENEKKIFLSGSYINSKSEKVYFTEIHRYRKDQKVQALITADSQLSLKVDDKEVKSVMDRYFNEN